MNRDEILGIVCRVIVGAWLILIIACFVVLCSGPDAFADQGRVTLTWDHNDPLPDGYRVFMRTGNGEYDFKDPAWQGNLNICTITGLNQATTYHFVVRAFVAAEESGDSNEVEYIEPVQVPRNLRLQQEISVFVDDNGKITLVNRTTNVIKP